MFQTSNNSNDTGVDRIEQLSTNPTPPPSYNQLPVMGINNSANSSSGSTSRVVVSSGGHRERYQLPGSSRNATASSVVVVQGSATTTGTRRGEPPSYEEAINPETPPPSYDSLFGRVREAHKSSTGLLDFLKNVVILLLGTREYRSGRSFWKKSYKSSYIFSWLHNYSRNNDCYPGVYDRIRICVFVRLPTGRLRSSVPVSGRRIWCA